MKTGQYYFRSRPARDAIKFTVNVDMLLKATDKGSAAQVMECLNTENNAMAKGNLGKKRRAVGQKPATLTSTEMKKPMAVLPPTMNAKTAPQPPTVAAADAAA